MSERAFQGDEPEVCLGSPSPRRGATSRRGEASAHGRSAGELRAWRIRREGRRAALARSAATLTHQLGTPLNVVSGRAALIVRETADPSVRRHAEIVLEQVQRIAATLRDFADFVAVARAVQPRVGADAVLEGAKAIVAPAALERGVELRAASTRPSGLAVLGGEDRLVEILALLLDHELERAAPGSAFELEASRVGAAEDEDGGSSSSRVALVVRRIGAGEPRRARAHHQPPWKVDETGSVGDLELHLAERGARDLGGRIEFGGLHGEHAVALVVPEGTGEARP